MIMIMVVVIIVIIIIMLILIDRNTNHTNTNNIIINANKGSTRWTSSTARAATRGRTAASTTVSGSKASLSCSGSRSSVQPIILGSLHTRDPMVLTLARKLTRLLVTRAQATASQPDLILCSSPGGFRPCQTLAQAATDSRESLESFLPLEFSPASLTDLQVFVYHGSHCAGDGRAGVGVCLFLVVGSQVHEVYRYQYFLGHMCTSPVAKFQGAYLALLIALSFLTWVAYHPRSASVP